MLSDPNIKDQSSSIYFDVIEYFKNQPDVLIDIEKITAIYENAIRAMIKVCARLFGYFAKVCLVHQY